MKKKVEGKRAFCYVTRGVAEISHKNKDYDENTEAFLLLVYSRHLWMSHQQQLRVPECRGKIREAEAHVGAASQCRHPQTQHLSTSQGRGRPGRVKLWHHP